MPEFRVWAEPRKELGKNANRRLRAGGKIPAVVYGASFASAAVSVDPKDLYRILHSESGRNTIFKLDIAGENRDVLIKDFQVHPVQGNLLHADFQTIALDQLMVFEVPVEVVGVAKGVKETGGVLDMVVRQIELQCLPRDVPDRIRLDVASLEIGDSIRVAELQVDASKITVLSDPDLVVVTVVPPHVEKEPEVVVEAVVAEPEVIKKGKAEEEEEAAAEGE